MTLRKPSDLRNVNQRSGSYSRGCTPQGYSEIWPQKSRDQEDLTKEQKSWPQRQRTAAILREKNRKARPAEQELIQQLRQEVLAIPVQLCIHSFSKY